jgi:predicted DNA-binding transcriptional regulator YafY
MLISFYFNLGKIMSDQMVRLMEILKMLPRYPKKFSNETIQAKLENIGFYQDIRTIQRDMEKLEKMFPNQIKQETDSSDKRDYWFWVENAKFINLSGISSDQALALILVKKYLKPLLPTITSTDLEPFFELATDTLGNLYEGNPLKLWQKKIAIKPMTLALLPPQVDPGIQHEVTHILFADLQLHIEYRKPDGTISSYELNPLGLLMRDSIIYLAATKVGYEQIQCYALHRIQFAEYLGEPSVRPKGFDLQTYVDEGKLPFNPTGESNYQRITLVAIFDKLSSGHLYESKLAADQTIEEVDADKFKLTATLMESDELLWWLQSFGSRVEVLEPPELRNKMADSVKALAQRYGV